MFNFNFIFADAALPWQLGFQDPATPVAAGIINFHNDLIAILIFVVIFVSWILFQAIIKFDSSKNPVPSSVVHGTTIEIIWTIIPAIILIIIAVPSFALLYSVDETTDPALTIKIVGRQWYWSYEFSDYLGYNVSYDSYILSDEDLNRGDLRLLEVDNRLVIPVDTHIRLIITSGDVLHSWAVPSFGVKLDACPGRLNQVSLFVERQGVFYGQCSELCGINHGFIPIAVEVTSLNQYIHWINDIIEDCC